MSDIYTRHVRGLGSAEDHFDEFWTRFLQDIRSELKNRHLLDSTPSFLGPQYDEYKTWRDPAAMNALAADCYMDAVLRRLKDLRALLNHSPSIGGAVRTNMRFFLIDRQRKANPTGYKIFKNIEKIIQAAIDQGRLTVHRRRGGKLRNETMIQLDSKTGMEPVSFADLERHVEGSELWGQILHGITGPKHRATHPVFDSLEELRARGVGIFRLRDLLAALRKRVRSADRLGGEKVESFSEFVRTILAKPRYEENEDRENRVEQIIAAIGRLKRRDQVKAKIKRLFERLIQLDEGQEKVVWERTYTELRISRSTFWEYIGVLRSIVKEIEDK